MNSFKMIHLFFLFGVVLTKPLDSDKDATIVKYENEDNGLGSYKYSFETSNGISRSEESIVRNPENPEKSYVVVKGSYSYTDPEGTLHNIYYTADENGFQIYDNPTDVAENIPHLDERFGTD